MTTTPANPAGPGGSGGEEAASGPDSIWVVADVDPAGTYSLTVQYNQDSAICLDRNGSIAYATELMTAAAAASYDAAVLAQIMGLMDMPLQEAGSVVMDLRKDRPPLDEAALGPLRIQPGVSARTHQPFLHCSLVDDPMEWQWTPEQAEEHALYVLQCYPVANLDNAYRRFMVGVIGLDDATARAAVGDLQRWRPSADTAPSITCPVCTKTSRDPNDIREGYCGQCHDWTGAPKTTEA